MNDQLNLHELQTEYPERKSGSVGMKAILAALQAQTAVWGIEAHLRKTPLYSFQTSIYIFLGLSLATSLLSLIVPISGAITSCLLLFLLILELFRPLLAKVAPHSGEIFGFTIPARNKEFQKLILLTTLSTDSFISPAPKLPLKKQLSLVYTLAFSTAVLNVLAWISGFSWFNLGALLPLAIILFLNKFQTQASTPNSLANVQVLMETAHLLLKAKSATTSVTFYFTDSISLNSGVLNLPKLLKGNSLAYLVNLIDHHGEQINLITQEGIFLPQTNDPFLQELLHEVATEKSLLLYDLKFPDHTAAYQLGLEKLKAITLTNPTTTTSNKTLRELLIGLIRKLEE